MRYLKACVDEYKKQFIHTPESETGISGEIKSVQRSLLDEKFHPSVQLKALFDKLLRRSKYPMEVAIVGQFSSGKSRPLMFWSMCENTMSIWPNGFPSQ